MIKKTLLGLAIPLMVFLIPTKDTSTILDVVSERYNTCGVTNTTFQSGEEITYSLQYKWGLMNIKAGEVTFKVEDMGDTYRFSGFGKTSSGIEWFYKVRDYYETIVDKETLLPVQSKKSLSEGSYRLYEKVIFDHENEVATAHRGKSKDKLKADVMPIESCMYDIMSVLYTTRNISFDGLSEGEKFPIRFFMDKKVYPLEVIYGGKESRKRIKSNGLHNTIMFKPQLIKNVLFPDGGEMNICVSDDENRVPLLIESPLSVGSVRAVLKKHKGLRSPIGSKSK